MRAQALASMVITEGIHRLDSQNNMYLLRVYDCKKRIQKQVSDTRIPGILFEHYR
jgi:hypothetical protein